MGCDIHVFIEYTTSNPLESSWSCFGEEINPGRDYLMFSTLADGVRGSNKDSMPIKGLPNYKTLSYEAKDHFFNYVVDSEDQIFDDNCITMEKALRYHSLNPHKLIYNDKKELLWAYNPDLHSHSWLTLDEYRKALNTYIILAKDMWGEDESDIGIEWGAILNVMEYFEKKGAFVRLVFCFDN